MKLALLLTALFTLWLTTGCGRTQDVKAESPSPVVSNEVDAEDDGEDEDESEEDVALDRIPAALKAAAIAAVPGFVPYEAEKETEGGGTHYCIHGHVGDEFVEVESTWTATCSRSSAARTTRTTEPPPRVNAAARRRSAASRSPRVGLPSRRWP